MIKYVLPLHRASDKRRYLMGYYVIKKSKPKAGTAGLFRAEPEHYFVLKADNHQTIATSEMYSSKQMAIKGIESVQKNGPTSEIRDETIWRRLNHRADTGPI